MQKLSHIPCKPTKKSTSYEVLFFQYLGGEGICRAECSIPSVAVPSALVVWFRR